MIPGNASDLDALVDAGVRGFKCFLVPSGVDEFPAVTEADLRLAMPVLAKLGVPLLFHAELPGPIERAARYASERQRFGDWIVGRGRDLGASIGMRAGAGARLGREELDGRAAAVVSAYAANADELSRLAVDGSIPGSA